MFKNHLYTFILISLMMFNSPSAQVDHVGFQIDVQQLSDKVYRLTHHGFFEVNSVVYIGEDGLLLIDSGYDIGVDVMKNILNKLAPGKPVKFILTTHDHGDHFGGNIGFADAVIIAHEKALPGLKQEYFALSGLTPEENLPDILIKDDTSIFFDGLEFQIRVYPGGHTDNDFVVFIPELNILAMGGLLYSDSFPFVDLNRNCDVTGMITIYKSLFDWLPENVMIIAGHGREYTLGDLRDSYDMLVGSLAVVEHHSKKGLTREEMEEQNILGGWASWAETPLGSLSGWLNTTYATLNPPEPTEAITIGERLTEVLVEGTAEEAVELYQQLKKAAPEDILFREYDLNMLGYQLAYRQRYKDALRILHLNADEYPESANVYDSLGENYLLSGDEEEALIYYKKALEVDPEYPSAKAAVERLTGD